jgi:hypothetical protein
MCIPSRTVRAASVPLRAPCLQIPPLFKGEATKEKLKRLGPLAPLTIHLRQEIDR